MSEYFPFATRTDVTEVVEIPLYKDIAWDFNKDEMIIVNGNPLILEGNEAIKVWIYKAIKTQRYVYDIYSWDYGCEVNSLLGKGMPKELVKSETARYIEEALIINPYISSISTINVEFEGDVLTANVVVNTLYGEVVLNGI